MISGRKVKPVIEGGKGIFVSNGYTAGAFANSNAVGTLSGVNSKLEDEFGNYIPLVYKTNNRISKNRELISYSINAAISQIKIANKISNGNGRIHINVLWEMANVEEVLYGVCDKASHLIHGITCGAGMPYKVAEIASQYNLYYYPIISSMRAFKILWLRSYSKNAKYLGGVVYEDPWLAGGHNGLSNKEDPLKPESPIPRLLELRQFLNSVGLTEIPIIIAGGVWYGKDWIEISQLLFPVAFQLGTRPILTKESSERLPVAWCNRLKNIREMDVVLHKFSPTGFYSSAIKNEFIQKLYDRSERQMQYSQECGEIFNTKFEYGVRNRFIYIRYEDLSIAKKFVEDGLTSILKTPDNTVIFVTNDDAKIISEDQAGCMGCLSHCNFSGWKDTAPFAIEKMPDPRSFCIQKTLQNSIKPDLNAEDELLFSGHNAYKFSHDKLFSDGKVPTISELVDSFVAGE